MYDFFWVSGPSLRTRNGRPIRVRGSHLGFRVPFLGFKAAADAGSLAERLFGYDTSVLAHAEWFTC